MALCPSAKSVLHGSCVHAQKIPRAASGSSGFRPVFQRHCMPSQAYMAVCNAAMPAPGTVAGRFSSRIARARSGSRVAHARVLLTPACTPTGVDHCCASQTPIMQAPCHGGRAALRGLGRSCAAQLALVLAWIASPRKLVVMRLIDCSSLTSQRDAQRSGREKYSGFMLKHQLLSRSRPRSTCRPGLPTRAPAS